MSRGTSMSMDSCELPNKVGGQDIPISGQSSGNGSARIRSLASILAHLGLRVLLGGLLLLPAMAIYLAFPAPAGPVMSQPPVVGLLVGSGQVRKAGETAWRQHAGPITLYPGDTVMAAEAAPLHLAEGSVLDLEPGTVVEFVAYAAGGGRLRLRQVAGTLRVDTTNPLLEIETPATVAALRPATFRIAVRGEEATLTVIQGMVEGRTGQSQVPVGEGEEVRLVAGQAQVVRWQRALMPAPTPVITPVPSPTPLPTAPPPQRIHIVAEGDTLLYIAAKYKTTVEAIMRANNLDDPHTISVGQKLIIPYTAVR